MNLQGLGLSLRHLAIRIIIAAVITPTDNDDQAVGSHELRTVAPPGVVSNLTFVVPDPIFPIGTLPAQSPRTPHSRAPRATNPTQTTFVR